MVNKKPLQVLCQRLKEVVSCHSSESYLSALAARISTVLHGSRLPGFIGLVPLPTLDKNIQFS